MTYRIGFVSGTEMVFEDVKGIQLSDDERALKFNYKSINGFRHDAYINEQNVCYMIEEE